MTDSNTGDTRMTDMTDEVDAALDRISSKGDSAWTCRQQARIELTELRAKLAKCNAALARHVGQNAFSRPPLKNGAKS